MSLLDHPAVYDDLLDVLAESADAERLRTFRLSEATKRGSMPCWRGIAKAR